MTHQQQPARDSARISMHERLKGREHTMEDIAFARRRDRRRARNKLAKASRKKNR